MRKWNRDYQVPFPLMACSTRVQQTELETGATALYTQYALAAVVAVPAVGYPLIGRPVGGEEYRPDVPVENRAICPEECVR
jgi:hypothetical protein